MMIKQWILWIILRVRKPIMKQLAAQRNIPLSYGRLGLSMGRIYQVQEWLYSSRYPIASHDITTATLLVRGLEHVYFSIYWEFHHPN
jgi:hypothetical protein